MKLLKKEIERLRKSHLARNTAWMMVGQLSSYAAQAAYFVVLTRLLGVSQFGILAGAIAFVGIFTPYGSMGSGIVFMHHVSVDQNNGRLYMGHVFLSSIVMSGVLVLSLWSLAARFLDPQTSAIVWMAAVAGCLSTPLTASISQIFQTFEMPKAMTAFNIINNTARLFTALALKILMHQAYARQWVIADMCISLIVSAIAVVIVINRFGTPRISFRLFFSRFFEGFGYSVSSSAGSVYNDFDKTLLSHYGMISANGIYSLAYRVVNFATMPSYAVEMAAVPRLFQKAQGEPSEFSAYGHVLVKRTAFFSVGVAVLLFVAAPIIPHLVGAGFESSVAALRWLSLLPIFRSVHEITGSMLTASGRQKYRATAQFLVAGVTLMLDLWLIPIHGWHGAAWASLVADALLAFMCYFLLKVVVFPGNVRAKEETR